ncbi:MAG: 30S ribosomal protein S6 [Candidatus Kaiserbacteria bacterium]|nr:30S ribosomal protein S6 [Candidatus Kaiserbacteria bacterium]
MTAEETTLLDADLAVAMPVEDGPAEPRIYELGYHIIPTVKEEDVEKIVSGIRSIIESAGDGSSTGGKAAFIAEGAPSLIRLAYPMSALAVEGEKRVEYDRGYFGWIKFESAVSTASVLMEKLKSDANILRFGIFRTVREDTRAKMKPPTLREVKRTDTIKSSPKRAPTEESAVPVSEEDLEKALRDITTE